MQDKQIEKGDFCIRILLYYVLEAVCGIAFFEVLLWFAFNQWENPVIQTVSGIFSSDIALLFAVFANALLIALLAIGILKMNRGRTRGKRIMYAVFLVVTGIVVNVLFTAVFEFLLAGYYMRLMG